MSAACTECVSAPTDTKSAPVVASSGMRASVTPPETSVFARPAMMRHGAADLRRRQVVEQDDVGAGVGRFGGLLDALRFDFDRRPGEAARAFAMAATDPAGQAHVVVLDQDQVEQPEAMVGASADAHGVLLEGPQRRRGLAGVEDGDAPAGGVDIGARRGGNAREPLEQVERRAFGRQQRRCRPLQTGEDVARHDAIAVGHLRRETRGAAPATSANTARATSSPATTIGALASSTPRPAHAGRNRRRRRDVAAADILGQGAADRGRPPPRAPASGRRS